MVSKAEGRRRGGERGRENGQGLDRKRKTYSLNHSIISSSGAVMGMVNPHSTWLPL